MAKHGKKYTEALKQVDKNKSYTAEEAVELLKKAAGVEKGSGEPNTNKVATVTEDQVREIAETKMKDLNAASVESAMRMVAGTARSMGFEVK